MEQEKFIDKFQNIVKIDDNIIYESHIYRLIKIQDNNEIIIENKECQLTVKRNDVYKIMKGNINV